MTFTEKEVELLIEGIGKLDQYDLGIKSEFDQSDYYAVQFQVGISNEAKYAEMHKISAELDRVESERQSVIAPILEKLNAIREGQ